MDSSTNIGRYICHCCHCCHCCCHWYICCRSITFEQSSNCVLQAWLIWFITCLPTLMTSHRVIQIATFHTNTYGTLHVCVCLCSFVSHCLHNLGKSSNLCLPTAYLFAHEFVHTCTELALHTYRMLWVLNIAFNVFSCCIGDVLA